MNILLLDVDGVLLINNFRFSDRLASMLDIPVERILPFFMHEFQDCLVGKADLREQLAKYLPLWGWSNGVEELLQFWLQGEANRNEMLITEVDKLRSQGVKAYAATNQDRVRADFIWQDLGLRDHLDGMFSSAELGFKKPEQEFYTAIISKLSISPAEISYWDDADANVAAGSAAGMDSHLYQNLEDFLKVTASA